MRTTSSVESMNAALRRLFPVHPHLFKFMERLQYHEFGRQIEMKELSDTKKPHEMKVPRYRQRDVKIKSCLLKLNDEEEMFTVGDFLGSLSNKSVLPSIGMNFFHKYFYNNNIINLMLMGI